MCATRPPSLPPSWRCRRWGKTFSSRKPVAGGYRLPATATSYSPAELACMLLTCPAMRAGVITAMLVLATVASVITFLAAAQHHGAPPRGNYVPQKSADWHLSGPDARERREAMLRRAEWRLSSTDRASFTTGAPLSRDGALRDVRSCQFVNEAPSGTTAKFNCVLDGGMVVK